MLTFQRISDTLLYTAQSELPTTNHGNLAYLLPKNTLSPPDTISLKDSWTAWNGYYVFLTADIPSDPTQFINALHNQLKDVRHSSFCWVTGNPDDPNTLQAQLLALIPGSGGRGDQAQVETAVDFQFRQIALFIGEVQGIELDADDSTAQFTIPNSEGKIYFTLFGTTYLKIGQTVILSLVGEGRGALSFPFSVQNDDIQADKLDFACYYFFPGGSSGQGKALRFPIFDLTGQDADAVPTLNMVGNLYPADPEGSAVNFADTGVVVASYFRTNAGHAIQLVPQADAKLVFSTKPNPIKATEPLYYLVPSGQFKLTVQDPETITPTAMTGPEDVHLVLCGLSGIEFLLLAEGDSIEFVPRQPAYAPDFSPSGGKTTELDNRLTTAWLKVIPDSSSGAFDPKDVIKESYCVQPLKSVYFGQHIEDIPFPMAIGSRLTDLSNPSKTTPFPMVPYSGVYANVSNPRDPNRDMDSDVFTGFEQDVIGRNRHDHMKPDTCLGPVFFDLLTIEPLTGYVQTSSGLLIELNDGDADSDHPAGTWKRLLLAKSPEDPSQFLQFTAGTSPSGCEAPQSPFNVVSPLLSTTLMHDSLFLVITQPDPLGAFDNEIQLGEYTFDIKVSGTDEGTADNPLGSNTVLIFKYNTTQSVLDLVRNSALWAEASTFVGTPNQIKHLSTQLKDFIQAHNDECLAGDQEDEKYNYFADFKKRMTDPMWTGVIALNCPLDYTALPIDIQMLLGGMDGPLLGHHFGITVNQIEDQQTTGWEIEKSSLFGLVHYDHKFDEPDTEEFKYQVLNLDALFENSVQTHFSSQIAMSIPQLYGDNTQLMKGGENDKLYHDDDDDGFNTIIIDGAYIVTDGQGSVVFDSKDPRVFAFKADDHFRVLQNVVARDAALVPLNRYQEQDSTWIVNAAFVLGGGMGFVPNVSPSEPDSVVDLFSYPINPDDLSLPGLGFSNYNLAMQTTVQGNSAVLSKPPAPDLSNIQVDSSTTQPRQGSLLGTLPLKLVGLRSNTGGITPASVNGLTMKGIGLNESVNPQYALEFQFNMGTLGALVANKEPVEGTVLLGWTSSGQGNNPDNTVEMLFVPPKQFNNIVSFMLQGIIGSSFVDAWLRRYTLKADGKDPTQIYVIELDHVDFTLLSLPMFYDEYDRALALFGDPNEQSTETKLGWVVGKTDTRSDVALLPSGDRALRTSDVDPLAGEVSYLATTSPQIEFKYTPQAGLLSGLSVRIDTTATQVIDQAIRDLEQLPATIQDQLNNIYANKRGGSNIRYDPSAGLLFWVDAEFASVSFAVLLDDPSFYGGKLEIEKPKPDEPNPILKSLGGLKFEIAYRKISDNLGVWSGVLTIPDRLRKWKFGNPPEQIQVEIPSFGLAIWTNGDWRVDVGWPFDPGKTWLDGNQFKIVVPIEGIPIGGTLGVYIAILRSADCPSVFGDRYSLICMGGLGASLGVGFQWPDPKKGGPIQLAVAAYFWVTAELMLAFIDGAIVEYGADYVWAALQVGVTVAASGTIDLKVIKVSLGLEATQMYAFAMETAHAFLIEMAFQFTVSLKIKVIFFSISFKFSIKIPIVHWALGSGPCASTSGPDPLGYNPSCQDMYAIEAVATPLRDIHPGLLQPITEDTPQTPLNVYFALQSTSLSADGQSWEPQAIASLLLRFEADSQQADDFSKLIQGVANWLVDTYGGSGSLEEQLEAVLKALEDGKFDNDVETCLSTMFKFTINGLADSIGEAVVLPMFPELKLTYNEKDIPFSTPTVPPNYIKEVAAYFEQLANMPLNDYADLEMFEESGVPQSVAGIVFADYFTLLGKQLVSELQDAVQNDPDITLEDALSKINYETIAGVVSRNLQQGMRLPDPENASSGKLDGLFALTGQQVALEKDDNDNYVTTFTLSPDTTDVSKWIVFGEDSKATSALHASQILDGAISPEWIGDGLEALQPLKSVQLTSILADQKTWTQVNGDTSDLRLLPGGLLSRLYEESSLNISLAAFTDTQLRANHITPQNGTGLNAAPTLYIPLTLRQIKSETTGEPIQDVYELVGTDEVSRDLLEKLLDDSGAGITALNMLVGTGSNAYQSSTEGESIVLAKVNLSTLSEPPTNLFLAALAAPAEELGPTSATLADVADFLRLVWEISIVHSGGYYLYITNLPDDAFQHGDAAISLLVQFGGATETITLQSYHNMLIVEGDTEKSTVIARASDADNKPILSYWPNYGGGAVGFQITWPSAPTEPTLGQDPTEQQKEGFLEALYNIVQYRVDSISGTSIPPTNWSMPLGANSITDPGGDTVHWFFRQTVPVAQLVDPDNPSPNRYGAIGQTVNMTVRLLDIYGNALPGSMVHPLSVPVVYNDPIIAIHQWPGMKMTYNVVPGTSGKATLQITAQYSPPSPEQGEQEIQRQLAMYQLVYDQLTDTNTNLTVSTVLAADPISSDEDGSTLQDRLTILVDDIVNYLSNGAEAPAPLQLNLSLDIGYVTQLKSDIFPVTVSLNVARANVEPDIVKLLPTAQSVTSDLSPLSNPIAQQTAGDDDSDNLSSLRPLAESFENAYKGFDRADGQLKLAVGSQPLSDSGNGNSGTRNSQLWAVRWGTNAGIDVSFPNTASKPAPTELPVYASPTPLSTQLMNQTVDVRQYKEEWAGDKDDIVTQELMQTFSDVDMDVWARNFLDAVHSFLAPEMATAIAKLDAKLDSDKFDTLLGYKETIAGAISDELEHVLDIKGQENIDLTLARERFRQALLNSLPNDYSTSSVVQLPANVTLQGQDSNPPLPSNLFGRVSTNTEDDNRKPYSLTPAKLPIVSGANWMPFIASAKTPAELPELDLDLFYDIGFVEHDFQIDERMYDYVPSSWLTFIVPLYVPDNDQTPALVESMGHFTIPIPLRIYPSSPVLTDQRAQSEIDDKKPTLEETLYWTYSFNVSQPKAKQDELCLEVTFNEKVKGTAAPLAAFEVTDTCSQGDNDPPRPLPKDLFEALARFTAEYPAIEPYLPRIKDAAFKGQDTDLGKRALYRFLELICGVEKTWDSWKNPALPEEQARVKRERFALRDTPDITPVEWQYKISFHDAPDKLTVTRSILNSQELPPWPNIEGYTTPTSTEKKDVYTDGAQRPDEPLQVSFEKLFVMTHQSARAAAYVVRNVDLIEGIHTNQAFIYRTPNVRFKDPLVPQNSVSVPIELDSEDTVADAVHKLFDTFVEPPAGAVTKEAVPRLKFGLKCGYEYQLAGVEQSSSQVLLSQLPLFLTCEDLDTSDGLADTPSDNLGDFEAELVKALGNWHADAKPEDKGALLSFSLTIFATISEEPLPLIQIQELQLPAPEDDEGWWSSK